MGSACAPIAGLETTDAKASNLQFDAGTEYALFLSIVRNMLGFGWQPEPGVMSRQAIAVVGKKAPAICRSQPSA